MPAAPKIEYVECKAYGHAWEPTAPVDWFAENWSKALHSVCVRCGTCKVDDLDLYGRPCQTIYYYSDGYRKYLDDFQPERAAARLAVYTRKSRRLRSVS